MELREGYQKTNFGVIPYDWEVKSIGSFSTIYGRIGFRGYTKNDIVKEGEGAIALSPSNIQRNRLTLDKCTYITWEKYHESPEIKIQVGDVILVKTGSTTGKTCYVSHLPTKATLNPQMVVFKKVQADKRLISYIFSTPIFLDQITATIVGGALPTLSQKQVAAYKIPLPPTRAEQEAIAEALSDTDALIESLEQLIAKKRRIKQGVMQKLLTGNERLPGFSGKWEERKLGDLLLSPPGYGINAPATAPSGSLPTYLRITDIDDYGNFRKENRVAVNHPAAENYYLSKNEIVFARTGASVGKSYLYKPSDDRIVFAGFLIRAKIDPSKLIPSFFFNYTLTAKYWNWVQVMSMRSGQPGINGNEFASLAFRLPPTTKEQDAISEVLNDMNTEITALKTKLTKTRQIKQGMMQQLLTGRIRLI